MKRVNKGIPEEGAARIERMCRGKEVRIMVFLWNNSV